MPRLLKWQPHERMEEVVGQDVYKTWKTEAEAAAKRWRDRTAFELFQEPSIKLAQEKYNGRVENVPLRTREELHDTTKPKIWALEGQQYDTFLISLQTLDDLVIALAKKAGYPGDIEEMILEEAVNDEKIWDLVKRDPELVAPTKGTLLALAMLEAAGPFLKDWYNIRDGIRREIGIEPSANPSQLNFKEEQGY